MPLISVIIPMYNAEATISRCVDSVFSKLSAEDRNQLEVLLIDDGSTDNTLAICKEIAKNNQQVYLFKKENGGVSSARNYGINKASSKWLCFIDCDDWLSDEGMKTLIEQASFIQTDLFIYSITSYYGKASVSIQNISEISLSTTEYLNQLPNMQGREFFFCSVCNKLYKTAIIKENQISFCDISYGEDFSFNIEYLRYINSVSSLNQGIYFYDRTTQNSGVKTFRKNFDTMLHCMNEKLRALIEHYHLEHTKTEEFFMKFVSSCWLYVTEICLHSKLSIAEKKKCLMRWYNNAPKDILELVKKSHHESNVIISSYLKNKSLYWVILLLQVKYNWKKTMTNVYYFFNKGRFQ